MLTVCRVSWLYLLNFALSLGTVVLLLLVSGATQASGQTGSQDEELIAGGVLRVGSGCTFSTIQAAVNSVSAGSSAEIRVRSGTYTEAVSIGNKSIQLVGGHASCITASPSGTSTIQAPGGSRPLTVSTGSSGAIFTRDAGTFAILDKTVIRDNSTQAGTGASLFAQTDSHLRTSNSLIFGGNAQGPNPNYVFWVGVNANVDVFWTTVADNLPGSAIFRFGSTSSVLTLRGSIIHEPGTNIGFTGGATPSVDSDCVVWHSDMLMNPPYNFTGSPFFHLVVDPNFVNRAGKDFQLQNDSEAVDFCDSSLPPGQAPLTDIVLNSRGLLTSGEFPFRPYDLGAFERIPDQLFRDRFEALTSMRNQSLRPDISSVTAAVGFAQSGPRRHPRHPSAPASHPWNTR